MNIILFIYLDIGRSGDSTPIKPHIHKFLKKLYILFKNFKIILFIYLSIEEARRLHAGKTSYP